MIPNSDITIYNKYIETRAEKYQRFELYGVVWQSQKALSRRQQQIPANTALVMIPFALGTQYVAPKAWIVGAGTWTLREGDIIVRGIVTDEIAGAYTLTDLYADNENVVMVTSVDAMDEGSLNSRHWEVNCK